MLPPRITALGGRDFRDLDDRSANGRSPFGASLTVTELKTIMQDGGAVVSVTMGDVVFRKVVYDDGRFHVQIEEARDRMAFAGSKGRASLTYGPETVVFVSDPSAHSVERARELVGTAKVASTFRQIAERMGRTRRTSAGAVSVRLTAALVAEIAGERGIASQVARVMSTPAPQYRGSFNGVDEFHDRWTEHAVRRLSVSSDQADGGDSCPRLASLDVALRALLTLEAAWYAIAARDEPPSRAAR
jgi:hypothetical protein